MSEIGSLAEAPFSSCSPTCSWGAQGEGHSTSYDDGLASHPAASGPGILDLPSDLLRASLVPLAAAPGLLAGDVRDLASIAATCKRLASILSEEASGRWGLVSRRVLHRSTSSWHVSRATVFGSRLLGSSNTCSASSLCCPLHLA
jgi:hypothetical protein